jgi:hypothetical protein
VRGLGLLGWNTAFGHSRRAVLSLIDSEVSYPELRFDDATRDEQDRSVCPTLPLKTRTSKRRALLVSYNTSLFPSV